ncbi:hypothetical protein D9758_017677 [Tetrapyrgos nigripes]|uniref:RNA-dependent RNA polymerase n=1 Tax=Tetrapyrgos nigripes TaxID=182062 RepID=A0A8H5BR35_9AGAR|nr:hypothetical protein D9758_017677 [Tetrapyrgos nigripes]
MCYGLWDLTLVFTGMIYGTVSFADPHDEKSWIFCTVCYLHRPRQEVTAIHLDRVLNFLQSEDFGETEGINCYGLRDLTLVFAAMIYGTVSFADPHDKKSWIFYRVLDFLPSEDSGEIEVVNSVLRTTGLDGGVYGMVYGTVSFADPHDEKSWIFHTVPTSTKNGVYYKPTRFLLAISRLLISFWTFCNLKTGEIEGVNSVYIFCHGLRDSVVFTGLTYGLVSFADPHDEKSWIFRTVCYLHRPRNEFAATQLGLSRQFQDFWRLCFIHCVSPGLGQDSTQAVSLANFVGHTSPFAFVFGRRSRAIVRLGSVSIANSVGHTFPSLQTAFCTCGNVNTLARSSTASITWWYSYEPHACILRSSTRSLPVTPSLGQLVLFVMTPDINPRNDMELSRGFALRATGISVQYCALDAGHISRSHSRHRIFDLSILNMWNNKVPVQVFLYLMEQGLTETLRPLGEWRGKWAMLQLWDTISKIGRVSGTQLAMLVPSASRALGFSGRERARVEVGIVADEETSGSASTTAVGNVSELVVIRAILGEIRLVVVGFNPIYDTDMRDTVRFIETNTIKNYMDKLRIPLPDGTAVEAFAIPYPLGVLKEGQIYYKPSNFIKNTATGSRIEVLEGEVLLPHPFTFRYPEVDIPALKRWVDVVIVPMVPVTQTYHDYEKMSLCRFKEHPSFYDFKRQVERVLQFTSRLADLPIEERQRAFQQTYLAGMAHVDVGLYSAFHDAAVWVHGYDSQAATRLAYNFDNMLTIFRFNYVLDSPKTGLRLREEVYVKGMQRKTFEQLDPAGTGKLIIDLLAKAGEDLGDRYLHEFDVNNGLLPEHIANKTTRPDQDLKKPWKDVQDLVQNYSSDNLPEAKRDVIRAALKAELDLVTEHVQKSYDEFRRGAASSSSSNNVYDQPTKKRSGKAPRRDCMSFAKQEYAKHISGISLLSEKVERMKASYAYHKSEKFGNCVGFKQLCAIKADASAQGSAPSTPMFDVTRSMTSGCRQELHKTYTSTLNMSTNVFTPVSYSRFPVARIYSAAATAVQQTESTSFNHQQFSSLKGAVSDDLVTALVDRPFNLTTMTLVQEEVLSLLPALADPYDTSKKTTLHQGSRRKAVRDSGLPGDKNLRRHAELKYARETVGALIISPTRELATQIANEALRLTSCPGRPVEVRLLTGGTNKRPQMKGWMTGRQDIGGYYWSSAELHDV